MAFIHGSRLLSYYVSPAEQLEQAAGTLTT
jgi:hypothetical protein